MTRAGLPHSVICGSQDVCSSPQLFAAYHDLLRQIAPRHPPWTLSRLTIFLLPSSLHFSYARLVLFPSLIPVKDHAKRTYGFTIEAYAGTHSLWLLSFRLQAPTSSLKLVEVWGFEPQTYGLQSHRSSQLSYTPGLPRNSAVRGTTLPECIEKRRNEERMRRGLAFLVERR